MIKNFSEFVHFSHDYRVIEFLRQRKGKKRTSVVFIEVHVNLLMVEFATIINLYADQFKSMNEKTFECLKFFSRSNSKLAKCQSIKVVRTFIFINFHLRYLYAHATTFTFHTSKIRDERSLNHVRMCTKTNWFFGKNQYRRFNPYRFHLRQESSYNENRKIFTWIWSKKRRRSRCHCSDSRCVLLWEIDAKSSKRRKYSTFITFYFYIVCARFNGISVWYRMRPLPLLFLSFAHSLPEFVLRL